MAVLLYNIFLLLFRAGLFLASGINPKAKMARAGRRQLLDRLAKAISPEDKIIWVHCASVGEFEQGRPVMEELKKKFPAYRLLLTFFSPSGYEARKNYEGADWVFYLPIDGPVTARRFLEITHPSLVIFVKYEFWYYYLKKINYRKIPLLLVSALFREDMSFFKWYGKWQQVMLARFDHLFVQNRSSLQLLEGIGLGKISSISGDSRFDRVIQIAEQAEPLSLIEKFIGPSACLVAGSTWPEDEALLAGAWQNAENSGWKWLIAPHEISANHIQSLQRLFPGSLLYSELVRDTNRNGQVLILDNVGMLSRSYRYGKVAYVGGGFRKMGVHNVLEPAVHFKPVLIGPYYKKYQEAIGLVESGGGIVVTDEKQLREKLNALLSGSSHSEQAASAAGDYVLHHAGATAHIMNYIQENRLLTS